MLRRHLPPNIASYDLAQEKTMYLSDVQRREPAHEADKKRRNTTELAKEAAFAIQVTG